MSAQHTEDNPETLFSFELLVEYIRLEKHRELSEELAVGVRLLDFPTLLIYQPEQSHRDGQEEHIFNRGKCCFFKMDLNSLHSHLSNTPLYAMVLDVKEETPRFLGSSLISLSKAMKRLRQDVTERGASCPSSHRDGGLAAVCSLTGEKIGSISLSYKLLCLGASLLPHITERRGLESKSVPGGPQAQERVKEENKSAQLFPLDCRDMHPPELHISDLSRNINNNRGAHAKTLNEEKQDDVAAEHRSSSQTEHFEEDLTVFCPPHLYYSNCAEEKSRTWEADCKLMNLDSEAFTFEDPCSEEEADEDVLSVPVMQQKVRLSTETSCVTSNVLGGALQQLPLLNALLAELSQLNIQNPQQPSAVHPSPAWIYKPVSTEPSAGRGNTPRKKTGQGTGSHLKHIHSPRNCSTPVIRSACVKKEKQEECLIEGKSCSKSPRKKLEYGTTKTFNLRMKQVSPLKAKHRECVEFLQKEAQSSMAKGKPNSSNKTMQSSKRKSVLHQSSNLNENVETVIQSVTEDSPLQGTVTLKEKSQHGKVHGKQDRDAERISEKPSLSERDLKFIHIPSADEDGVPQSNDKQKHHSESDQSPSEFNRDKEKIESAGGSRCSSTKSSFSDSSRDGNEEADYVDDFNSLEPSDAYSPDPASSPEPSRAKTPKSPVRPDFCPDSDSGSEGVQKRATVLPVPVKASTSPQRALRGTYIIRPRTLSFSDEDGDRDGPAALQTAISRKPVTASSSGGESFTAPRGERSKSPEKSGPVRGMSAESISSFEPQEAEELEDELGSLDFRKEYQHISQLVASKLPGYTM